MFKQLKSAIFWYYLYKFRKKVVIIVALLLVALFSNAIYADVVQYLTLKEKLEFLELALFLKWSIILGNLIVSVVLFLSLFKRIETQETKVKKVEQKEEKKEPKESKLTAREEEFLHKKLKTKADRLVERE